MTGIHQDKGNHDNGQRCSHGGECWPDCASGGKGVVEGFPGESSASLITPSGDDVEAAGGCRLLQRP